ncbi:hypothetical protein FY524_12850 [Acinetobacter baumannii]|nr:hypothetical protein CEX94_10010 [Acinetobacter baumannii]TYR48123.1 hypothetical protein FY524_12850 [Acinetobacter baumannii]
MAEAKQKITNEEFHIWWAYRQKRGSLFIGRRIEQAIGNLFALYISSKVKKGTKIDALNYMPHESKPEPQDLESFLRANTTQ